MPQGELDGFCAEIRSSVGNLQTGRWQVDRHTQQKWLGVDDDTDD